MPLQIFDDGSRIRDHNDSCMEVKKLRRYSLL